MSSGRSAKAIYVDRALGLVVPEGTPAVIAQLARDLYRFGDFSRQNHVPGYSQTFFVLPHLSYLRPSTLKQLDWAEIARMRIDQVTEVAVRLALNEDGDISSDFAAHFGLYQLNRALDADLGVDEVMESVALAGHCLGLAAFAKGLAQAPGEVASRRWKELNKVKAEMQQRYQLEREECGSKAEFIRRHKDEVFARLKAFNYPTNKTSVVPRMRRWLAGL